MGNGSGVGGVPGTAVAAAAAGAVLMWSGVKGASVTGSLRSLLSGQAPTGANVNPVTSAAAPLVTSVPASLSASALSGAAAVGSDSAIASAALKYQGHCYLYGGHSGPSGASCWDCSSFVSYVLGHDAGLPIPGGSWASVTGNGSSHGPTTLSYLAWSGAQTVGHTADVAQAGDLVVWQTHMGVAIGGGQMISAQDPALGTGTGPISMPGEMLFVRRVIIGNPNG